MLLSGVKVTCKGPPGHGSRFIEGTAAEKMVSALFQVFVAGNVWINWESWHRCNQASLMCR